eukprot:6182722-Pleurochrysis_carterae.AAC.5
MFDAESLKSFSGKAVYGITNDAKEVDEGLASALRCRGRGSAVDSEEALGTSSCVLSPGLRLCCWWCGPSHLSSITYLYPT